MPAGYYTLTISRYDPHPRPIKEIEPVIFVAICRFEDKLEPVTCYAVQKTMWGKLNWFHEDSITIHAYGAYVEACKLVYQQPLSFIAWVSGIGEGVIFFNTPLEYPAGSAAPATTSPQAI